MTLTTPRLALPYPQAFDTDNVPAAMLALATKLDNSMTGFTQGVLASRPVGGAVYGKWYYATDTAQLFYYQPADANNTAGWRLIGAMPTSPSARWYSNTKQSVQPPVNDAAVPVQLDWAFGPGSGWDGTFPAYYDLSSGTPVLTGQGWGPGPAPTVPVAGIYRIKGQVQFFHVQPRLDQFGNYRTQNENYVVFIYRAGGSQLLALSQLSDEFMGFGWPYPTVEFETTASFDLSTTAQSGVEVWVASSVSGPYYLTNVIQQVQGGAAQTFLEMRLIAGL